MSIQIELLLVKDGSQQCIFPGAFPDTWYRLFKNFFFSKLTVTNVTWTSSNSMTIIFGWENHLQREQLRDTIVSHIEAANKGTVFTRARQILEREPIGGCFLTPKPLIWIMWRRQRYPRAERNFPLKNDLKLLRLIISILNCIGCKQTIDLLSGVK